MNPFIDKKSNFVYGYLLYIGITISQMDEAPESEWFYNKIGLAKNQGPSCCGCCLDYLIIYFLNWADASRKIMKIDTSVEMATATLSIFAAKSRNRR